MISKSEVKDPPLEGGEEEDEALWVDYPHFLVAGFFSPPHLPS